MNIIISGGSKGIGKELVKKYLEHGDKVFTFSRNPQELLKEFDSYKDKLHVESIDLAGEENEVRKNLIEGIEKAFGNESVDKVISNAGAFAFDSEFSQQIQNDLEKISDLDEFTEKYKETPLIKLNLFASKILVDTVLARALSRGEKITVGEIGSIGALDQLTKKQFTHTVVYNKSKAAAVKHLLEEYGDNENIKLRIVHPGPFGESADKLAEAFGDTYALPTEFVAQEAFDNFEDNSDKRIIQKVIVAREHFFNQIGFDWKSLPGLVDTEVIPEGMVRYITKEDVLLKKERQRLDIENKDFKIK